MPKVEPVTPNLTTITFFGRQAVKGVIIGIVGLMVGRVLLNAAVTYWKAVNPPPPPAPTVGFGLLPPLVFPKQTATTPTSYRLETPNSNFPNFPDRAEVLFVPQSAPSLLDHEDTKKLAATFNFVFEPQVLDDRTYRFTKSEPLPTTLDIDTIDHTFIQKADYLSRPDLILKQTLPANYDAAARVKNYLERNALISKEISTASAEVTFLKITGGQVEPAVSLSDADLVQVDLQRFPLQNQYKFFTESGAEGIVHALIAGFDQGDDSLVEIRNSYRPANYDEVHTYPLREVRNAWKLLQSGQGYIVKAPASGEAVIRSVNLGYYDSTQAQEYIQPVFVFAGDDGFLAFVSAIDPAYHATAE